MLISILQVPPGDADAWQDRIDGLQSEIDDILREEKEQRALQTTERDLTKADNMIAHRDEIMTRPKKTWFESEKDKAAAKQKGREALNGSAEQGELKQKKRKVKLSNKQKKKLQSKDEIKAGLWKKGKRVREGA